MLAGKRSYLTQPQGYRGLSRGHKECPHTARIRAAASSGWDSPPKPVPPRTALSNPLPLKAPSQQHCPGPKCTIVQVEQKAAHVFIIHLASSVRFILRNNLKDKHRRKSRWRVASVQPLRPMALHCQCTDRATSEVLQSGIFAPKVCLIAGSDSEVQLASNMRGSLQAFLTNAAVSNLALSQSLALSSRPQMGHRASLTPFVSRAEAVQALTKSTNMNRSQPKAASYDFISKVGCAAYLLRETNPKQCGPQHHMNTTE